MHSGSHVQLAALRNRNLELQTTFGLLSLKRQVIMVQFLSINFFLLDFFNFCWVFQKFPFFVSPCLIVSQCFSVRGPWSDPVLVCRSFLFLLAFPSARYVITCRKTIACVTVHRLNERSYASGTLHSVYCRCVYCGWRAPSACDKAARLGNTVTLTVCLLVCQCSIFKCHRDVR